MLHPWQEFLMLLLLVNKSLPKALLLISEFYLKLPFGKHEIAQDTQSCEIPDITATKKSSQLNYLCLIFLGTRLFVLPLAS